MHQECLLLFLLLYLLKPLISREFCVLLSLQIILEFWTPKWLILRTFIKQITPLPPIGGWQRLVAQPVEPEQLEVNSTEWLAAERACRLPRYWLCKLLLFYYFSMPFSFNPIFFTPPARIKPTDLSANFSRLHHLNSFSQTPNHSLPIANPLFKSF